MKEFVGGENLNFDILRDICDIMKIEISFFVMAKREGMEVRKTRQEKTRQEKTKTRQDKRRQEKRREEKRR